MPKCVFGPNPDMAAASSCDVPQRFAMTSSFSHSFIKYKLYAHISVAGLLCCTCLCQQKKFKVETECENWIQKYDNDMGQRQVSGCTIALTPLCLYKRMWLNNREQLGAISLR